ncbi:MAG: hypothetical protein IKX66_03680 [Clostridia bacterium]|nr:hypothetical protein [Clostridia bacterium]
MADRTEQRNGFSSEEKTRITLEKRLAELWDLLILNVDQRGARDYGTLNLLRVHEGVLRICNALPRISDEQARVSLAVETVDFLDYVLRFRCGGGISPLDRVDRSPFARFSVRLRIKRDLKEYKYRTLSFFKSVDPILEYLFPPSFVPPGFAPRQKPVKIEDVLFCPKEQPFDRESETMKLILARQAEKNGETVPPDRSTPEREESSEDDVTDIL